MRAIELLEPRIAPATLTGRVLTYDDPDGDHVTVKFSKGTLAESDFTFDTAFDATGGQQLQLIDLGTTETFKGANITVSVVKDGGDGLVKIGTLNAGVDLGQVKIAGDLSRIVAGDSNAKTKGLIALTVTSFGAAGTATQGSGGSINSTILGGLGSLKVAGDFSNMYLLVTGGPETLAKYGKLGKVNMGGDLVGGTEDGNGYLECTGSLGKLTLVGEMTGGAGEGTGKVLVDGNLGSAVIGSLTGGTGNDSGKLRVYGKVGKILVKGDITGGDVTNPAQDGAEAGVIEVDKTVKSLVVKGDLVGKNSFYSGIELHGNAGTVAVDSILGGGADYDGSIIIEGKAKKITVTGGIVGGDSTFSGTVLVSGGIGKMTVGAYMQGGDGYFAGSVNSGSSIGRFSMVGNMIGGSASFTGTIFASTGIKSVKLGGITSGVGNSAGSIYCASGTIKTVHITGDMTGSTEAGAGPSFIAAGLLKSVIIDGKVSGGTGGLFTIAGVDGIGSVKIGKDFTDAQILAGSTASAAVQNASIGSVKIGGNFTASNIIAGMSKGGDNTFGTTDDAPISSGNPISKIAKIIIAGTADGTAGSGDHFGIEASQVKSVKINGSAVTLLNGAANDFAPIGTNDDLIIWEALSGT